MFCTRRERAAGRSLVRLLVQLEKFFSRQRPKLWNAYREAPRNSFFIFILVEPFNFGLFYARVGFTKLFECSIVLAQAARRYRPIIFHWHLPRAVRCREQFPDGAASEHVRQNCSMGLLGRSCPSPRCKETTDIQLRLLQRLTEDALVGWDCFSQLAAGFGPSRPLYSITQTNLGGRDPPLGWCNTSSSHKIACVQTSAVNSSFCYVYHASAI